MTAQFKVHFLLSILFCQNYLIVNSVPPRMQASSTSPPNLSLYKYEGNFYPIVASEKSIPNQFTGLSSYDQSIRYLIPVQLNHQIYHDIPETSQADYGATSGEYEKSPLDAQPLEQVVSNGQHVESGVASRKNPKIYSMSSGRRNPVGSPNGAVPRKTESVTRHYHDIFLKMKSPQELIFGHVLNWPDMAQKNIEKRERNHYKGQVIWADKKGGYGEHYWDLVQGAL